MTTLPPSPWVAPEGARVAKGGSLLEFRGLLKRRDQEEGGQARDDHEAEQIGSRRLHIHEGNPRLRPVRMEEPISHIFITAGGLGPGA